jgi:hypothetical protein
MTEARRKFAYRLDALLKLRVSERDALTGEVRQALKQVETKKQEHQKIEGEVRRTEDELRALCASGAELAIDVHMRLQGHLQRQRTRRAAKQLEVDDASRLALRALGELQTKVKDAKALEHHKGRKQRDHERGSARSSAISADDRWLQSTYGALRGKR